MRDVGRSLGGAANAASFISNPPILPCADGDEPGMTRGMRCARVRTCVCHAAKWVIEDGPHACAPRDRAITAPGTETLSGGAAGVGTRPLGAPPFRAARQPFRPARQDPISPHDGFRVRAPGRRPASGGKGVSTAGWCLAAGRGAGPVWIISGRRVDPAAGQFVRPPCSERPSCVHPHAA